jgi:hypothetical protein
MVENLTAYRRRLGHEVSTNQLCLALDELADEGGAHPDAHWGNGRPIFNGIREDYVTALVALGDSADSGLTEHEAMEARFGKAIWAEIWKFIKENELPDS